MKYLIKVKVPGVGNYRLPSEFGYYENARKYWFFMNYKVA